MRAGYYFLLEEEGEGNFFIFLFGEREGGELYFYDFLIFFYSFNKYRKLCFI